MCPTLHFGGGTTNTSKKCYKKNTKHGGYLRPTVRDLNKVLSD